MGFQSIFAWKALPEAGFAKKRQLLMRIDLSINASPRNGLIVTQHRSFLKPRESGTSLDPSLEHALASAALAASFKRPSRHERCRSDDVIELRPGLKTPVDDWPA
jgi:hypothetical protein